LHFGVPFFFLFVIFSYLALKLLKVMLEMAQAYLLISNCQALASVNLDHLGITLRFMAAYISDTR
jgi:hypothetical protein